MQHSSQSGPVQSQPEFNVNPRDLPWSGCSKGPQTYESVLLFKRISAILSPTGKEEHAPVEAVVCKACGKIPSFIYNRIPDIPEELRSTCDKD